jgi:predicted outer membrane protein
MRSHIMMAVLLLAPGATLAAQDTSATQTPQRDTIRGYNDPQQAVGRRDSLQGDNALLMKIHKINQMEIQAGQLAQRNSSTAKVKTYGQRLVSDHQAADKKITALAQRLGVTFPREGMDSAGKYDQGRRWEQGRDSTMRPDTTNRPGWQQRADTTSRADTTHRQDGMMKQPGDAMHGHDQDGMQEHAQLQKLGTLRGTQFDAEFANAMAQGHDKAIKMLEQAQSTTQNAELRTLIQNTLPTLRTHLQMAQALGGTTTTTATSSSQ